uniref:Uncharacterized protein n=1 Tax=Arundo donax TaxID=35708 RepID=A0A0A9GP26_ARUDO
MISHAWDHKGFCSIQSFLQNIPICKIYRK